MWTLLPCHTGMLVLMHSVPWALQQNFSCDKGVSWQCLILDWVLTKHKESNKVILLHKHFYCSILSTNVFVQKWLMQLCCSLVTNPTPTPWVRYNSLGLTSFETCQGYGTPPLSAPLHFWLHLFPPGRSEMFEASPLFSFALSLFHFQGPSLTVEVFFLITLFLLCA